MPSPSVSAFQGSVGSRLFVQPARDAGQPKPRIVTSVPEPVTEVALLVAPDASTDAVVVVVSEETGVISCVIGGVLRRYLTPETLERVLREELLEDSAPPVRHRLGELFGKMRNRKEEDDHAEK